jgi:hypothetical protein
MAKRRHQNYKKHSYQKKEVEKKQTLPFNKFFFWFIVYFLSISLLTFLFIGSQIYQNKIGFYLVSGYLLVLISRVIYSAKNNKQLRLNGIVAWGLIYALVFGLLDYLLSKLPQIQFSEVYDPYIAVLILSILFTIALMFLRRMKLGGKRRFNRAPSQIFSGILLIVAGILSWRFSKLVFLDWFNWAEGMAWSWLIGLALIVGGFLVLLAWWRNNVLQHRFGLKVGKW